MKSYYTLITRLSQKYQFMSLTGLAVVLIGLLSGVILIQTNQILDRSALTGGPVVFFDPTNKVVGSGSVGNTYDIYLSTKGYSVTGVNLSVSYDARYITPIDIEISDPFVDLCSSSPYCEMSLVGGVIELDLGTGMAPFTGETKLGTIHFNTTNANVSSAFTFTSGTVITAIGQSENALGGTTKGTVCIGECGGITLTVTPATGTPTPTSRNRPSPRISPTIRVTATPTSTPTVEISPTSIPTGTRVPTITRIPPNISSFPTPIVTIIPGPNVPTMNPCRLRIFGLCLFR